MVCPFLASNWVLVYHPGEITLPDSTPIAGSPP